MDERPSGAAGNGGLPARIGRYRIESELGRGGMAVVYRAVLDGPRGFAKQVCLKRILPGSAGDPLMVEMFEREARIAATLQHANVVQLFDFDLHEGTPFLVMELVDGPSLWQVFGAACAAGRPLPPAVACGIVVQALAGLHHVHTCTRDGKPLGLVHRDVSLHNILVSRAGEVKVADFGIARATRLGERTRTGVLKGKLAYIAPEYAATGRADGRADLFSVGVVLHELLSGRRRTPPGTDAEGLGWVLHPQLAPLGELRPDVPDALAAAVQELTATLPGDRPEDAVQAAARLTAAQTPAGAAEIARCLEALVPARRGPPAEPTRPGPVEGSGETVPTPSPFDPTLTRRPTGDLAAVPPGVCGELTPDASTAVPEPSPVAARPRRRAAWLAAALLAVAAAAAAVWIVSGPPRAPSSADAPPIGVAGPVAAVPPAAAAAGAPGTPEPLPSATPAPARTAAVVALPPESPAPSLPPSADRWPSVDAGAFVAPGPAATSGDAGAELEAEEPGDATAAGERGEEAGAGRRTSGGGGARPAAVPAAPGTLEVFVLPWAYVSIDGSAPEETPVRSREVTAGRHLVVIENPRMSCRLEERIDVPAGEVVVVRRSLFERCGGASPPAP
ncbi:MAG: protein kinase [Deltaproteobacteria bacterium]|nr:protein kinase [Deltaproteobacteria bacterium]